MIFCQRSDSANKPCIASRDNMLHVAPSSKIAFFEVRDDKVVELGLGYFILF